MDALKHIAAYREEFDKPMYGPVGAPSRAYLRVKPIYDYLERLRTEKLNYIERLPLHFAPEKPWTERATFVDLNRLLGLAEWPRWRIEYCIIGMANRLTANSNSSKKNPEDQDLPAMFELQMRELFQANSWPDVDQWIADFLSAIETVQLTPRFAEPVKSPDGDWKPNSFSTAALVENLLSVNTSARSVTGIITYSEAIARDEEARRRREKKKKLAS